MSRRTKSQHFLLSAAARTLSLATVLRLSDTETETVFAAIRWPETNGGPVCPACDCDAVYDCRRPSGAPRWRCKRCRKDFSLTSGTLFAFHKLALRMYLAAVVIFVNEVKGKPSRFSRSWTEGLMRPDGWLPALNPRKLIEDVNEMATAAALLDRMEARATLHYEPPLAGTKKRIDFLVRSDDGKRAWFEVKSIRPSWDNGDASWQRFERLAADFPGNAKLIVQRELAGAAIAGQAVKARWGFLSRENS